MTRKHINIKGVEMKETSIIWKIGTVLTAMAMVYCISNNFNDGTIFILGLYFIWGIYGIMYGE